MDSNQLFKYVYAKYGLKFEPAIPGSTSVYVLMSPVDSGYFAMLSRFKNSGESSAAMLEMNCGSFAGTIRDLPGFMDPIRMRDADWVGIMLGNPRNDNAIRKALDYAFKLAMNDKQTNVSQDQFLYIPGSKVEEKYKAQPIKPRPNLIKKNKHGEVPDKIRKMLEMYDYSILPTKGRGKNFYVQGRFMADYEDNYPKFFTFKYFYPTYHDMNVGQLRSYFTWRTKLRKGDYRRTSTSYAYVYIYELLNNLGVKDPQEGYDKLLEFKHKYVEKFDLSIASYLDDWLKEYVLFYNLGSEAIKQNFDKEIQEDHDYLVLRHPEQFSAKELAEVFAQKTSYWNSSKVICQNKEKFIQILQCVWRELLNAKKYGIAYYSTFIAKTKTSQKKVFFNAVFYPRNVKVQDQEIDAVRKYAYLPNNYNPFWSIRYDEAVKRQKTNLNTFLHELDRVAREKLKLGRPIKPRFIDQAVLKAIDQGIINYQEQEKRAKINQIKIDFSDLDKIRANASATRESLLTDEEKELEQEESKPVVKQEIENRDQDEISSENEYGLDQNEMFLLIALLEKKPWQAYLKQHHLMASILVDSINEKLMDEIGDSVIEFDENDQPQIIEDYQDDLEDMFLKG
ncbi:TerB N-terminal domain-containing protein [Lactobacillus ultunensis]|uniref:TerB-C domain-containing protein n=1 Tax=Lactobacillus ultunensis DSM 16047 TaxID=525365 RepID=C2ELD6_9LACO|nr:TerB N-terminal domain-containing protein [Lactobacillus ultunensis]EEJ72658.1 hypothetical protein HMPREF0548_0482 [Lactobacillus ultunensis DSM 16047]KRL80671.1 hypothetical protein FC57_GL001057 [Lactobacillus ultunensis DSM 16047]QQP28215.1 TerB N-terminal domain-containing protein [Lactobacillus ultunensis]